MSLIAGLLFAAGYALMARSLAVDPDSHPPELSSPWMSLPAYMVPPDWILLGAYYVLAGTATSASYFAAVSTSAKSFPRYGGLAIGVPCAVFAISPLVLSRIASWAFVIDGENSDELDVVAFLAFLSAALFTVNLLGAVGLRVIPPDEPAPGLSPSSADATETSVLLPAVVKPDAPQTIRALVRDPTFWSLGAVLLLVTGPAEMIQASLGSIVESLLSGPSVSTDRPWPAPSALRLRATHVQAISLFNCCARLLSGALSDWLAPTPGRRKARFAISRLLLMAGAAVLFSAACLYVATGLRDTSGPGLWVLRSASHGSLLREALNCSAQRRDRPQLRCHFYPHTFSGLCGMATRRLRSQLVCAFPSVVKSQSR